MAFTTPKLDRAASAFQAHFAAHPQLYTYGQFYLGNRYLDDMLNIVRADLGGEVPYMVSPHLIDPAGEEFRELLIQYPRDLSPASVQNLAQTLHQLAQLVIPSGTAVQTGIFTPGPPDVAGMKADYEVVWSTPAIGSAPPWLAAGSSLFRKYIAAYPWERDKCFATARAFARKLQSGRNVASVPQPHRISEGVIAGASPSRFRDPNSGIESEKLRYNATLTSYAPRLKAAIGDLERGAVIQCGVLSGAFHEQSRFPKPEHYILVFAHDTLDGQQGFLFWDPDTGSGFISGKSWGRGFGLLFLNERRLSTARDDQDFLQVHNDRRKRERCGDYILVPHKRHRYQVFYLQTLPM